MSENMEIPQGEELEKALAEAYRVYQGNIRATGEMIFSLTKGAREGRPEAELLALAREALEKCEIPE